MSAYVKFHTFEQMDDAVVLAATPEATNYPAEHAIAPLEPNMAWRNRTFNAQALDIDLGAAYACDCLFWICHGTESVSIYPYIDSISWSNDGSTWTSVGTLSGGYGYTGTLIKVATFTETTARYWRVIFRYAGTSLWRVPVNTPFSAVWLGTTHELDRGPAFPLNDAPEYPYDAQSLPYGKSFRTGRNVNSVRLMERTWQVNSTEYDVLAGVLSACNGSFRPFAYKEGSDEYMLCMFAAEDEISEERIDTGFWRVTFRFNTVAIVQRGASH